MIRLFFVFSIAVTSIVSMGCADSPPPHGATDALAFVDVDVIPMDGERVIRHQTVVISDGLISSMGEASDVEVPAGATRIEASGRFLIPGLCDMHAHLEGDAWNVMFPPDERFQPEDLAFDRLLFPYLANGVTTVQIMSALPEHVGVRESISNGEMLGPRLILSRMVDGPDRAWPPPISTWVGSPEEARQAVIDAHATGYDAIKVYSFLDRSAYETIVATARELGLMVVGHVPYELTLDDVLAAGQDLIAHSEEVLKHAQGDFSSANIDRLARSIAESGTWVIPTLTTSRNVLAVLDDFESELDRPEVRALHPMSLGVWAAIYERLYRPIPDEQRAAIRQGFEDRSP